MTFHFVIISLVLNYDVKVNFSMVRDAKRHNAHVQRRAENVKDKNVADGATAATCCSAARPWN